MPNTTITEEVRPRPSSPNEPAGRAVSIRADLRKEYVAGGAYAWTANFWRSLPWAIDDLTLDFGDDIYERMSLDPVVDSSCQTLKLGILSDGVNVLPCRTKDEDGYDRAVEISDFVKRNFDGLADALDVTLLDMLTACQAGSKVAEANYKPALSGPLAGNIVLESLKVKPRRATVFVVDVFMNVVGLLGLIPGQPAPLLLQSYGLVGKTPENLLPRKKFAILTWGKHDNDPRGSSLLRSCYTPWLFKVQMLPEWMKHLSQFGGGSIWGTVGENATKMVQVDAAGNPVIGVDGQPVLLDPVEVLALAIASFQNGTYGAFPFGTEIHVERPATGENPFSDAIKNYCNAEMQTGILGQTLATSEGQHQARAAADVHSDILALRTQYGKALVADMLYNDVVKVLVGANFPTEVELCPKISLSETEQQDRATLWTAAAALGYQADPSQFTDMDVMLQLPERSEESVAQAVERLNAPLQAQNEPGGPKPKSGTDKAKMSAAFSDPARLARFALAERFRGSNL